MTFPDRTTRSAVVLTPTHTESNLGIYYQWLLLDTIQWQWFTLTVEGVRSVPEWMLYGDRADWRIFPSLTSSSSSEEELWGSVASLRAATWSDLLISSNLVWDESPPPPLTSDPTAPGGRLPRPRPRCLHAGSIKAWITGTPLNKHGKPPPKHH